MAVVSQGQNEFAARIQRIEKRAGGTAELFNAGKTRPGRPIRHARRGGGGWLIKLPLALAVGAVAFVAAQYATFRIGDLPEEFSNPDYVLAGQAFVALFLVFVARLFFNLTAKTHFVLSLVGMVAAMSLMHNLVHLAPGVWAEVFSNSWVQELRAHTQPGTLYFRGTTIPLSELRQLTLG